MAGRRPCRTHGRVAAESATGVLWWAVEPMTTTQSVLRRGIQRADKHFVLVLDPAFQGLPDTAHGGSVLAVFDALAGDGGPRSLVGHYRRRVPLDVPLALTQTSSDCAHGFMLSDAGGNNPA